MTSNAMHPLRSVRALSANRSHPAHGQPSSSGATASRPWWLFSMLPATARLLKDHAADHSDPIAEVAAKTTPIGRVEAILLATRQPLSVRKLAQFAGLEDGTEARTLVRKLQESYLDRDSAFQVEMVAGGYQLFSRSALAPWLRRGVKHGSGTLSADGNADAPHLTVPALETLSVVAYRQPILRAEIESIRGVGCGELLRQLMDRGLLRIVGRSQELGRPFLYGTTNRFLQEFGLRNLDDLPGASQLRKRGSHAKVA